MNERPDILITGATGFIGSHLATRLLAEGRRVRCMVRPPSPTVATTYLREAGADLVVGDLIDRGSLVEAMDGIATVFHLGGGGRLGMPEQVQRQINVDGTRNLIEAAIARGGLERFVHGSTCAVMGHVEHPPADETYPYHPQNLAYSRAKTAAEKLALAYRDRLPLVVVRFPGVIGAPLFRQSPELAAGVTPFGAILAAVKHGSWRYIGDGFALTHMVAVEDAVTGLLLAAERGRPGEVYIIAGTRSLPMRDLIGLVARQLGVEAPRAHIPVPVARSIAAIAELLARLVGGRPVLSREMVTGFTGNLSVSIAKARRELRFEPAVSLEQAIADSARWYAANGYL